MKWIYAFAFPVLWTAWAIYWFTQARHVKSNLREESEASRWLHVGPLALATCIRNPHSAGMYLPIRYQPFEPRFNLGYPTSAIYVLYEWPLWARNFIFASHGRTLYAYTNFDIHPGSFIVQEMVIFGFCQLLASYSRMAPLEVQVKVL